MVPGVLQRSEEGSTSRSRAGRRLHPEVGHGAVRRRWCEWGQPHNVSWRAALAADAEWMSGKSRNRLAPVLTKASSWRSDPQLVEDLGVGAHVDVYSAPNAWTRTHLV